MSEVRLDHALVVRGLARSRSQAQQLVRAGLVRVDGAVVTRPARQVGPHTDLAVEGSSDPSSTAAALGDAGWITRGWVGRGAVKLEHALRRWEPDGLTVAGRRCLDVGASTGGFTQILLEHGARHVTALDVGHDQLDERVRDHPRVTDLSGTSVRDVDADLIGGRVDVLVADLSFISLSLVLPTLATLVVDEGHLVLLVKPQFEVGRQEIGRTGVVRSAQARARVLERLDALAREVGLSPVDLERSPVTGGTGNIEYLWWLRVPPDGMMDWGRPPAELEARRRELRGEEER